MRFDRGLLKLKRSGFLFHNDRCHRPEVDRAEMFVHAKLVEFECKRVVLVERAGTKQTVNARHRVVAS
jgi:hypothetical protein